MKTRDATLKECSACHHKEYETKEAYACDHCRADVTQGYLAATLFKHGDDSTDFHYCSWRCLAAHLRTVRTDYFISLPYLSFDIVPAGQRAEDFFELFTEQRQ